MIRLIRNYYVEFIMVLILISFFYLLMNGFSLFTEIADWTRGWSEGVSPKLLNLSTIFLSIFIEGLPFILMGVFISSIIHVFVKEEMIWRWLPQHSLVSVPLAAILGLILPICECGIVPVARRLIQKGLPSYVAFTFLLAAPIINPVTIVSTYVAFGDSWDMVTTRLLLAAGIAVVMGWLFQLVFKSRDVLKKEKEHTTCDSGCEGHTDAIHTDHSHQHDHSHGDSCDGDHQGKGKWNHTIYHAVFEFFDMGKYFVMGALIAASFQTLIGLNVIKSFGEQEWLAVLIMMALAFGLSICSSADAFVAASFRSSLGTAPMAAFLVYGPMMDLKNVLMMLGSFRKSVVLFFFLGTTVLTVLSVFLFI
ncbi:permease [Hazenella coriacea]|uniref:Permease n=1 Tax=Hazenella coriacea TaxID=1179467 RepID=A0A4R3L7S6_9BACL|nr:permease [Hazenella coriacea]TCS95679.1 hypothetical protein EDD58_102255 [Hazenella coriacea]